MEKQYYDVEPSDVSIPEHPFLSKGGMEIFGVRFKDVESRLKASGEVTTTTPAKGQGIGEYFEVRSQEGVDPVVSGMIVKSHTGRIYFVPSEGLAKEKKSLAFKRIQDIVLGDLEYGILEEKARKIETTPENAINKMNTRAKISKDIYVEVGTSKEPELSQVVFLATEQGVTPRVVGNIVQSSATGEVYFWPSDLLSIEEKNVAFRWLTEMLEGSERDWEGEEAA